MEKNGTYRFATVYNENNKVIAGCGFHPFDFPDESEIVYHFAQNYWGKGLATEAVEGCLQFAKQNHLGPKIIATIHPENIASQKVIEKFGFQYLKIDQGDLLYQLII